MSPSQPEQPGQVEVPAGLLALTTYGTVQPETVQSLLDLRGYNDANGITNIQYATVHGTLVDKSRNESVRMMLQNPNLKYIFFIDADMSFAPDLVQKILLTAYHPQGCSWADAVGGYCQLRGKPYLCTIDTGTGTWESHDARVGPIEVIRTGSACILIKRHVFERLDFPWYGVRPAPRPIDMLLEVDNFARCKMDGRNPLREHAAWAVLEQCAKEEAATQYSNPATHGPGGFMSSVGEDSSACDRMKALGFRIVVQTDAVCGHIDRYTITPELHMEETAKAERMTRLASGILA